MEEKVTIKLLEKMGACQEAINTFRLYFLRKQPTWHMVVNHTKCKEEWKPWLGLEIPNLTLFQRKELAKNSPIVLEMIKNRYAS